VSINCKSLTAKRISEEEILSFLSILEGQLEGVIGSAGLLLGQLDVAPEAAERLRDVPLRLPAQSAVAVARVQEHLKTAQMLVRACRSEIRSLKAMAVQRDQRWGFA
jgi:hypothetical protein